jgi:nucleotide-binding universal stress UspA family protein
MASKQIILLVDDSKPSKKAAKECFGLAEELKAKVALVYVIDPAMAMGDVDAGIFPDLAMQALKKKSEKLLISIKNKYNGRVISDLLMPVGDLPELLPKIIKQTKASMVVMGTHGRTGLNHFIAGSVAENVLKISSIPVLVVPVK